METLTSANPNFEYIIMLCIIILLFNKTLFKNSSKHVRLVSMVCALDVTINPMSILTLFLYIYCGRLTLNDCFDIKYVYFSFGEI